MEELKPFGEILKPDDRNVWRNITLEFLYGMAAEHNLLPSVPENIRHQFEVARHACVYAWFYQPLSSAAMLYTFLAIEHALSIRFKASPRAERRSNEPGLKELLRIAIEECWIQDSGFDIDQREQVLTSDGIEYRSLPPERARKPTQVILEVLPDLRNSLAHGQPILTIESVSTTLQRATEIINQLFPSEENAR